VKNRATDLGRNGKAWADWGFVLTLAGVFPGLILLPWVHLSKPVSGFDAEALPTAA